MRSATGVLGVNKKGFTLIEIMIGILLVSLIMVGWFSALSAVTVWKVKLIEKTNMEKEAFYFSEKLFETIKKWWTLDYEEYWNRKVVWNASYDSGHFLESTWFWNFGDWWSVPNNNAAPTPSIITYGDWFYYCLSEFGDDMWVDGCLTENSTTAGGTDTESQRYGQYALQFIDFNINADVDIFTDASWTDNPLPWDEDGNGSIIGDDDDEILGEGPSVFDIWDDITELYLISWDKKRRTYFRYHVIPDPDKPSLSSCDTVDERNFTGAWCLGTIQFLELEWKDWWSAHVEDGTGGDEPGTRFDGIIDTWIISPQFSGSPDVIAGADKLDYWEDLFPSTISVSEFKIHWFPNKDRELAWKEDTPAINTAPYIRLSMKLQPSWKKRKLIKSKVPELDISTTISLSDLYSQ